MSDTTSTQTQNPDGHYTHGGGNAAPGGVGGPVSNQSQLILDHSTFSHLPKHHLHAIKIVQLEFARDVSARAAAAYTQVLDVLRNTDSPPEQKHGL